MSTSPRVSVVLPVYNGEAYLEEALDSLQRQTWTDFEVVAVDDGSSDHSWQLLEAYAARDPRFVPIRHPRNLGHHEACNRGIASARGELIAKFDQDDVSLPERLERQVAFLSAHPEVGLLGTAYFRWPGGETRWPRHPPLTHSALRWKLLFENVICHSAIMLRKSLLSTGELYYAPLPGPQDYDLWVRLLRRTRGAGLSEPLVLYRVYSSDGRAGAMSELFRDKQPAAVAEISARQLGELLPELASDQLHELRRVAGGSVRPGELALVDRVFDLFARFGAQPDIDPAELEPYRRRFLYRAWRSLRRSGADWRELAGLASTIRRRAPLSAARLLAIELPGKLLSGPSGSATDQTA